MANTVPLATRITPEVDRRLRMKALIDSRPLSHVLVSLLEEALPPVGELAAALAAGPGTGAAA